MAYAESTAKLRSASTRAQPAKSSATWSSNCHFSPCGPRP
jgi:hypothetical protein